MAGRRAGGDGRNTLAWAFLGSAGLHLLLLLLGGWLPLGVVRTAPLPDESRIRFTFAPRAERDVAGNAPSIPQARPVEPVPVPPVPVPAPPVFEPQPSVPAAQVPPAAAADSRPPAPDAGETSAAAGVQQPEVGDSPPFRSGETQSTGSETAQVTRRNLDRALNDFDRALDRARSRERRSGPPGGGAPVHVFVPDLAALPATGYGVGNLEFSTRDFDWDDYGRQIYIAIWRAWHNRLHLGTDEFERWAFRGQNWLLHDQNRIVFTIERNGGVTGIAIETPSGCIPLDRSATDALDEVVLPPLPADFPKGREVVRARFLAEIDVQVMRRHLEYLKRMGLF